MTHAHRKRVNKLTDEQIVKALEQSPLNDIGGCRKIDALDLIKRQRAEIEQKDIEIDILIRKKEALKDEISELQSEVERLKEIAYMYNSLLN